jgi:hypothetical protein
VKSNESPLSEGTSEPGWDLMVGCERSKIPETSGLRWIRTAPWTSEAIARRLGVGWSSSRTMDKARLTSGNLEEWIIEMGATGEAVGSCCVGEEGSLQK